MSTVKSMSVESLKADGSNFRAWKLRMVALLQDKGAWGTVVYGVNEDTKQQAGANDEEKKKAAESADHKASMLISLSVADPVMLELAHQASAAAKWNKLLEMFERPSKAAIMSKRH